MRPSALNTVGLTSGVTSSDLPWHGKAVLVVLMRAGRLEVVAVAVLVLGPLRSAGAATPRVRWALQGLDMMASCTSCT